MKPVNDLANRLSAVRVVQTAILYSTNRIEQNLRFAGQYYNAETGLRYNTLRYYDPKSDHFTQQDPIGLLGGFNLYQYTPNPLMWFDPLELSHLNTNSATSNFGVYKLARDILSKNSC